MGGNLTRVITLFGGLALFLYSMDELSRALEAAAGQRMKGLLAALTGGPLRGVLTGLVVTAVLQSSSAVTVMLIGFVSAGLLTLRQAVPVIFGANIGTTATAQLLAFRFEDMRWAVLLAGVLLGFACRGQKGRAIGRALTAFGLLFEGITVMGGALAPLAESPLFRSWMLHVRENPLLGLLAGLGMTLTVQSSSATIAVLQNLAAQPGPDGGSILGLMGALPILLGDNVGTTITAALASLGRGKDAQRTAAAHAVFNLSGAVVFCMALPWFARLTEAVSPVGPETEVIARQIANGHTLFNLICTAVWLPQTPVMVKLVLRLIPDKSGKMIGPNAGNDAENNGGMPAERRGQNSPKIKALSRKTGKWK